jgi:para-nitrobenzyl esterase
LKVHCTEHEKSQLFTSLRQLKTARSQQLKADAPKETSAQLKQLNGTHFNRCLKFFSNWSIIPLLITNRKNTPTNHFNTEKGQFMVRNVILRLLAISLFVLVPINVSAQGDDISIVKTTGGIVRGVATDGLLIFKGIPYAASPIGERRWRPPEPVEPWSGVSDATEFGPACPQTPDELELSAGTPLNEDCLTLNIWTPAAHDAARPVLVWIHGGGFSWGTARNDLYDGAQFARRGDLVVVSIQYRLGAFGWLNLKEVGGDAYATSGNLGLLDQIAALEWVQANITAFGGDPNNVTVAGESAGGISIGSMIASPLAEGLIHKAILQSGSPGLVATEAWSKNVTKLFIELAKAESIDDLLALSTDEILAIMENLFNSQFSDTAFHPVIDGYVLPSAPMQQLAANGQSEIPILLGWTMDEARYWLYYLPELDRLPLSYSKPWLNAISGGRADEIIATYQESRPNYSDPQIGLALVGDVAFRMPAVRLAESLSRSGVPVYLYQFDFVSPLENGRFGSPHAIDLPFTFHNLDAVGAEDLIDKNPAYIPLADQIQDTWIAFIRTGNPNHAALPSWPTYDTTTRATMRFDFESRVENDPLAAERKIWGDIPFDGLTPPLGDVSPETFEGTRITPAVVIAVLGTNTVVGIAVALLLLLAAIWWFGRKWLARYRSR